jgi:hypothetical protein
MSAEALQANPLSEPEPSASKPLNPYLVLLVAILLPGFGYTLCGVPRRGFTMQMFMIVLAFVSWHLASPDTSLIGKLAGGIFVYALSLPETYRLARLRWVAYQQAGERTETAVR